MRGEIRRRRRMEKFERERDSSSRNRSMVPVFDRKRGRMEKLERLVLGVFLNSFLGGGM